MLYLLCFFVIISDFPKLFCATGSKMFKGFQRLSQTFHVSYVKSRNSRGKAQSRTRSRGQSARAMPPHPTPDACETLQQYVATNRSHYGSFF